MNGIDEWHEIAITAFGITVCLCALVIGIVWGLVSPRCEVGED